MTALKTLLDSYEQWVRRRKQRKLLSLIPDLLGEGGVLSFCAKKRGETWKRYWVNVRVD